MQMHGPTSLRGMNRLIDERGPRYAVSTLTGPNSREYLVHYEDTAEQAEQTREWLIDHDYAAHHTEIHPPEGSIDLAPYARARRKAMRELEEATSILRAAVLRALESGRAEAEVARAADVDRMTVRKWAGK